MAKFRGNIALKGKNVKLDWTPDLIQEYMRCQEDIYYFIEKYFKIVTEDGTVPMVLRDYQKEMLDHMMNGRFTLACMSRQSGKALDLNTPILTPHGMKLFKEIHVGDEIYSVDGKITKVTFETETMNNHVCYEVKFDNGEVIVADADHIWTVEILQRRNKKSKILDITTKNLITLLGKQHNLGQSVRIKISDPIQYEKKELSLDPYILGLWLGDGNSRANIEGLYSKLNELDLLQNKHIPDNYIFSSIEQRIALIQGMMDTGGSVTDGGSFEFYQKKKNIIEQFRFILSSLGVKSRVRSKEINGECYYTVSFCHKKYQFFRLPRKLEKIKNRNKGDAIKNYYFYIKSITSVESVPVKCIQVDNPSHLFLAGKTLIPTHNTETFRAFLIWYILFNDFKTVAVVANKLDMAMEIITKLQISYQLLPQWLQLGVKEFNKGSFVLENESRLFASATSKDALRGFTCHIIVIDEAAHIENWAEFYGAVAPTISAGKQTKLIMASTPNGLNHFYEFYEGSSLGKNTNGFHAIFVPWHLVPGRDDEWQRATLQMLNFDYEKFSQEYNCSFIGSSGTLISGARLQILKTEIRHPLREIDKLKIYEAPVKERKDWRQVVEKSFSKRTVYDHQLETKQETMEEYTIPADKYSIVADVSRGKGLDYSAFSVFNITRTPYVQVATFRDNNITPTDYAHYIYKVAQLYNEAIVLVEINDIGEQVSTYMMDELEYENVLCTQSNGRAGKTISFNLARADKGVRTTITLKNSGCLLLKLLLEECRLIIYDEDTINELLVFIKEKNSYAAEKGKNDDLAMTLVLFSWLSDQKFFLEWTSINTVAALSTVSTQKIADNLLNFGYIVTMNENISVRDRHSKFEPFYNMNIPFKNFGHGLYDSTEEETSIATFNGWVNTASQLEKSRMTSSSTMDLLAQLGIRLD